MTGVLGQSETCLEIVSGRVMRALTMADLWVPFGGDVLERSGGDDGKGTEEDICLWIGKRSQTLWDISHVVVGRITYIIIFLTGSIPQTQVDRLSIYHYIGRVVIENGWDVLSRKGICCV